MVLSNRRTKKSALKLKEALDYEGYEGLPINFGNSLLRYHGEVLNKPENVARAVNKKLALEILDDNDIPTPLISEQEAREILRNRGRVVCRKTYHMKGRGFWCVGYEDRLDRAKRLGATYFLKYIENAREFRVHIVGGQSIKISEKIKPFGVIKANHDNGTIFQYPEDFNHKKTLRNISKDACEVLELDFAAVDILWKDDEFYIIELNSAPALTDDTSDTLERYVQAFLNLAENPQTDFI